MQGLLQPHIDFFCRGMQYEVIFHSLPDDHDSHLIYEDRSIEVYTLPLCHRLPSCGFRDDEQPLLAEAQAVFPNTLLAHEGMVIQVD